MPATNQAVFCRQGDPSVFAGKGHTVQSHQKLAIDTRGAAIVETALMLPILLFLLLGIFAFTYVSYAKTVVSEAAREAASVAAVRHGLPGANPVAEGKEAGRGVFSLGGLNPDPASITITVSGGISRAEVSYPVPDFVSDLGKLLGGGEFLLGRIRSSASTPLETN